jgi:hypothetical protein
MLRLVLVENCAPLKRKIVNKVNEEKMREKTRYMNLENKEEFWTIMK